MKSARASLSSILLTLFIVVFAFPFLMENRTAGSATRGNAGVDSPSALPSPTPAPAPDIGEGEMGDSSNPPADHPTSAPLAVATVRSSTPESPSPLPVQEVLSASPQSPYAEKVENDPPNPGVADPIETYPEICGIRFHSALRAQNISDLQECALRGESYPETCGTRSARLILRHTVSGLQECAPRGETSQRNERNENAENAATPSTPATGASEAGIFTPLSKGKSVLVDQSAQMLYAYEDGVLIRALPVSTGVLTYYTPAFSGYVGYYAGTLYSEGFWADNAWYITKARGNIYIHSLPYTFSETGEKIFQGVEFLGVSPSSHGCIRLHPDDAQWFTDWNPGGAFIVITPPDFKRQE